MTANYFRIISLLLFSGFYIFDFIPIVRKEVKAPVNIVRRVSWYIYITLLITFVTIILSLIYQVLLIHYGYVWDWYKVVVTLSTTIGGYANIMLLRLILHYRYKE